MNNNKIGSLWKQEGKSYLTGNIKINGEDVKVIVFENNDKKNPKAPDYNILLKDTNYNSKEMVKDMPKEDPFKVFGDKLNLDEDNFLD